MCRLPVDHDRRRAGTGRGGHRHDRHPGHSGAGRPPNPLPATTAIGFGHGLRVSTTQPVVFALLPERPGISVSPEGARFTAITNPGRPRVPKQTGCASGPAFTREDVPARSPETFQSISRDVRSAGWFPETAGRGGTASPADAGASGPAHTIMTGAPCRAAGGMTPDIIRCAGIAAGFRPASRPSTRCPCQ